MTHGAQARASITLGLACGVAWLVTMHVLSPLGATQMVQGDGYYTWLWTRSIVLDHDVDFEQDYRRCGDPWELLHAPHGDAINQWNPGPSLFWIPIFAFDVARADPALGGPSRFQSACGGALANRAVRGSLIAGILTLLLAFAAARRISSERAALIGALCAMCTPVTYYATMLVSYGHAASACTSGMAVLAWTGACVRPTRGAWLRMGAAIGLAMLTRPQNAILAILPLCLWLELAWPCAREGRWRALARHVAVGLAFVLMLLLVFAPQVAFWWDQYGELFFVPQGRQYMRWGAPRIAGLLFSACTGLFQWSPVIYVAVAGWALLAVRSETRRLGVPLLLLFAAATYVNACATDWWGAIGFPGRRFDALTVPFALGITAAVARAAKIVWIRASGLAPVLATTMWLCFSLGTTLACVAIGHGVRADLPLGSESAFPSFTAGVGRPLEDAIGDPFTWPASLPFAMRYGVHPRVWRWASQPELFFHTWLTMTRSEDRSRFDFVDAHAPLLVGFGAVVTSHDTRVRTLMGCARAIVPISWPEIGALRFAVSNDTADRPSLWVSLDGESLGTAIVAGGATEVTRRVTRPHQGILEMRLCTSGVLGLRTMEVLDQDPTPAHREADYLTPVRERRVRWRESRRAD